MGTLNKNAINWRETLRNDGIQLSKHACDDRSELKTLLDRTEQIIKLIREEMKHSK